MRKVLCIFIVLFALGGIAAFSQEGGGRGRGEGSDGVAGPSPWYSKNEAVLGFKMGFTMSEDGNLANSPTAVVGFRRYVRPVFRSLVLGYSALINISFPSEMYWKSPDGQFISISRDDLGLFIGAGGLLGASLQGRMFGPVGLTFDAGLTINSEGGRGDYSWAPQFQRYNINYTTFDLGLGMNAGMFVDFGGFSLEGGANLGYSFFRSDNYVLYESEDSRSILGSERSSGVASIIKLGPYLLFGFRF